MSATTERPPTTEFEALAFATRLGWMAIEFHADVVTGIQFGHPSQAALLRHARGEKLEITDDAPPRVEQLQRQLTRFALGEPQTFADVRLSTTHLTPFAARVIAECRNLAWGEVATYAELAARVGRPGAARAVGNVMASNRFPLVVPCHRVVGSGGSLGGYSAPGGLRTKRQLLDIEQASQAASSARR